MANETTIRMETASSWELRFLRTKLENMKLHKADHMLVHHYTDRCTFDHVLDSGLKPSEGGYKPGWYFSQFSPTSHFPKDNDYVSENQPRMWSDCFDEFQEKQLQCNYGKDLNTDRESKVDLVLIYEVPEHFIEKDLSLQEIRRGAVYIDKDKWDDLMEGAQMQKTMVLRCAILLNPREEDAEHRLTQPSNQIGSRLIKSLSWFVSNYLTWFVGNVLTFYRSIPSWCWKEWHRTQVNHLYTTREDFSRMDPKIKRWVVMGQLGVGKSALLNIMGGFRLKQRLLDHEIELQSIQGVEAPFESRASPASVTSWTCFSNLHWFGDSGKPFVAVDTPGYRYAYQNRPSLVGSRPNPPEQEFSPAKLSEVAEDLFGKLQKMQYLNAILVLHPDVVSNRFDTIFDILQVLDEKFGQKVWNNIVIIFPKCNTHETYWRSRITEKISDLQSEIKNQFTNCKIDIPVMTLGGLVLEQGQDDPASGDFEKLWNCVKEFPAFDASNVPDFPKSHIELIQKIDKEAEQNKAANQYLLVLVKLVSLILILVTRSSIKPQWVAKAFLLHFFPSYVWDEVMYLGIFIGLIGPQHFMYSMWHLLCQVLQALRRWIRGEQQH